MSKSTLRWSAALIALTTVALHIEGAQAQRQRPDRTERREERQQGTQNMTPEQRRTFFQQRMQERMKNMTPEQRQQFQERMQQWQQNNNGGRGGNGADGAGGAGGAGGGFGGGRGQGGMSREERQRQLMIASGITEEAVQDAIILFVNAQEKTREPLLEMARKLGRDLANPQIAAEKTMASLTTFRTAVAEDKVRYDAALAELDAKIKYTTTPKLEAFLTLIGVLGVEAPTVGGPAAIFAAPGGGGNFGNRRGGPQFGTPPGEAVSKDAGAAAGNAP